MYNCNPTWSSISILTFSSFIYISPKYNFKGWQKDKMNTLGSLLVLSCKIGFLWLCEPSVQIEKEYNKWKRVGQRKNLWILYWTILFQRQKDTFSEVHVGLFWSHCYTPSPVLLLTFLDTYAHKLSNGIILKPSWKNSLILAMCSQDGWIII